MTAFSIARVYDTTAGQARVLADRLWPRGLSKDTARLDLWAKDLAPSTELRRWYGHDHAKWEEFGLRYRAELDAASATDHETLTAIDRLAASGPVVLLTASRDLDHSDAVVLRDWLLDRTITGR